MTSTLKWQKSSPARQLLRYSYRLHALSILRKAINSLVQDSEDGLSVALHLTTNSVCGWPGAAVVVVTITTRLQAAITNLHFQAVLPRGCRVKAMPPSTQQLPAASPFAPPPAATQVLVLAPAPEVLGFVLTYTVEGETVTDIGKDIQLPAEIRPS